MTRITMLSVNRQTQSVIHTRFAELANLQRQMATGKLLNRPSDGPAEASNAIRLRNQMTQLKQNEANIWDGLAWMEMTDTSMTSMLSVIHRARELGLQGDNSTLSADQRKYIADEVGQLANMMVNIMNTRYKGNYLFSGTHTDMPAVLSIESDINEASNGRNRMFAFDASGVTWDPAAGLPDPSTGLPIGRFMPPIQIFDPNGHNFPSGFTLTPPSNGLVPVRNVIPGSVEISFGGNVLKENVDFRIDHINGTIELLPRRDASGNLLADNGLRMNTDERYIDEHGRFIDEAGHLVDVDGYLIDRNGDFVDTNGDPVATGVLSPESISGSIVPGAPGLVQNFSSAAPSSNYPGGLQIRMTRLDESKDFYGDNIVTDRKILRHIEEGVTVPINVSTHDLRINSRDDIFTAFIRLGQGLINGETESINAAIALLDQSMHNILSAQATNGAIMNRFSSTLERNEIQQVEVERLRSNVEDADYATTVSQFALKQTVFNAALQSTARIMQMSLMDFIR